jgi:transposase
MKSIGKYRVHLTNEQRSELETFVANGQKKAREISRARILLYADAGQKDKEIAALLGVARQTVSSVRKKYCQASYDSVVDILKEAPRPGRPIHIDSRVEANISMVACSAPPTGSARWTLHMIADKLVKLEVIDAISHESVRQALKKPIKAVVI